MLSRHDNIFAPHTTISATTGAWLDGEQKGWGAGKEQRVLTHRDTDLDLDSAAGTPVETPTNISFQFLNFNHPDDAKSSQHRKKVRSHVTKQQHQREQALTAARRAKSYQEERPSDDMPQQRAHASTFPSQAPSTSEQSSSERPAPSTSTASSQSPSPVTSPAAYSPAITIDPLDVYPPEWHSYIPRILDHYNTYIAVDNPDVDGRSARGLNRSLFSPFLRTDLAPLHATMLVAASHYSRIGGSRSHAIDLLQLRGMAISEINGALADDARGTSDHLIMAVAIMATYEALFGDRTVCSTHMQGLTRMVSLRGGLPALGLDGFLERTLLYVDANVSHITNTRLYFDPRAFPSSSPEVVHPQPDPLVFSSGGLARRTDG
nr:hypothetical protein B0A51_16680 [Rachicladosporium sp. CCFEE 5018]